jgi:hypothetical protein
MWSVAALPSANVTLAGVLGNNRVTFAALPSVTYQLHFHGADWLNFTERGPCNENLFLASYTSRDRGYFGYLLSQGGKGDDS